MYKKFIKIMSIAAILLAMSPKPIFGVDEIKSSQTPYKISLDRALLLIKMLESRESSVPESYRQFKKQLEFQLNGALDKQCASCYRVSLILVHLNKRKIQLIFKFFQVWLQIWYCMYKPTNIFEKAKYLQLDGCIL